MSAPVLSGAADTGRMQGTVLPPLVPQLAAATTGAPKEKAALEQPEAPARMERVLEKAPPPSAVMALCAAVALPPSGTMMGTK